LAKIVRKDSEYYSRIGRLGAHRLHASHDPQETTRAARAKSAELLDARLLREIEEAEPGLTAEERLRRLGHARKAHFLALALKRRAK
jgi:hypothetical protein